VFFALPGGSGLEYSLSGTSEPPKPINRISREVPCKTDYIEPLTVENWLSKPQRSAKITLFIILLIFMYDMMIAYTCALYIITNSLQYIDVVGWLAACEVLTLSHKGPTLPQLS